MHSFNGDQIKKIILTTGLSCLLVFFVSCPNPQNSGSESELETKPEPEPSTNGKTYLKINNNTEYAVNLYINDPPLYNDTSTRTLRQVKAGGSGQWELQPTPEGENGSTLYFEYLIPVGDTIIPYYPRNSAAHVKLIKLIEGQINPQEVPLLGNAQTDSIFILIKNTSRYDTFWLLYGGTSTIPFGSSVRDIPAGKDALYVFDGNTASLNGYTVGNHNRRNFPDISLVKGMVYSFIFDGNGDPGLFLLEPFDPEMRKSIWTMPTYTEPVPKGLFLTTGLFSSRANARTDGYILSGRVNYDHGTVLSPYVGTIPYMGMISPVGEVTRERRINLRANPSGLNLLSFIEDSNELAYVGQVYYDDIAGRPCILSTDTDGRENYFYDGFIYDINNNQELYGQKLVKWDANSYAIGCQLRERDINSRSRIYIAKVTKLTWESATHQEFWKSPEEDDVVLLDLLYDRTYNMLVVLADIGTGSAVYFVNAEDGTLKYPTVYLNNYWMNGFFPVGNEYYVAGGYEGVSGTRGFIARIDIVNGIVNTQNPWLIDPAKYEHGSGGIRYILPENDGTLILAGWCVEDNRDVGLDRKYQPWLVKYDLNARNKNWEQIYNDHEGYEIFSVHHNAIGSYLLEIYNAETYHSYLISTDLLGKISGNMLPPLPRNTSLFSAAKPGNPGISIDITPLADASLSTPARLNLTKGQNAVITVQGTWTSYQWYVNGLLAAGTGSSFTFTTSGRNAGVYTVTAVVSSSTNEKRSASCRVTVTN